MIDTEDAIMCHGASDRALPSLHRMAPMVSGKGVFYTVCNGTCNTTTPYCSYCLTRQKCSHCSPVTLYRKIVSDPGQSKQTSWLTII